MKIIQKLFIGLAVISIGILIIEGFTMDMTVINARPELYVFPEMIGFFIGLIGAVVLAIITQRQAKLAKKRLQELSGDGTVRKPKTRAEKIGAIIGVPIGLCIGLGLIGTIFILVDSEPVTGTFTFLVPYKNLFIGMLIVGVVLMIVLGVGGSMAGKRAKEKAAEATRLQAQDDFEKVKAKAAAIGLPRPPVFVRIPNSNSVVWFKDGIIHFYYDYTSDAIDDVNLCIANDPWFVRYEDIVCYKAEGSLSTEQKYDPGKSDSALGGMGGMLGGMIGGNAGQMMKLIDSVNTGHGPSIQTITHDDRKTMFIYKDGSGLKKSAFPIGAEELFDSLIPEKSFIYLQSKSIESMAGVNHSMGANMAAMAASVPVMQEIMRDDEKQDDIEEKLMKLSTLLEKKLISPEEYERKKKDLLSKL